MKTTKNIIYTITPPRQFSLQLKELWQFRELFYFFSWRDIKVKYKQTLLGFLWAILQPLVMMSIFILFFAKSLKLSTDGMPPAIFYYSGLLLWNLFSSGISNAGNSMISHASIIKKVYFPRLIIPLSSVLTACFDFLMALLVFFFILLYYYFTLDFTFPVGTFFLYLFLGLSLSMLTAFGAGTLLASLNVKYRDFRYIIPFLVQFLFFVTPVIYPISVVADERLSYLLALNPMTGAIQLMRTSFTNVPLDPVLLGISVAAAIVIFMLGIFNFKRTEAYFADLA
ncbi:MAG: ABC transporter permease [Saprospiraceae bacterium]